MGTVRSMATGVNEMNEWGVFSDEGMIDGPFYSETEALEVAATYPPEERVKVGLICPDHEGQPSYACEECLSD